MVEVFFLEPFRAWFLELDAADARSVTHVLEMLREIGLRLGAPYSSALEGTDYPLRELRPKAGHSPLRIIYAFDPERAAIVITGGDKSGDPKFYKRIIGEAEGFWDEHLAVVAARREQAGRKEDPKKK